MTTLAEQLEELGKELKKLSTIKGRWMKNVWFESAFLASLVVLVFGLLLLLFSSISTTPLPSTETPLDRTIYPNMYQDYP